MESSLVFGEMSAVARHCNLTGFGAAPRRVRRASVAGAAVGLRAGMAQRLESVAPAAHDFTVGDAIEAIETRTAATRPSPRELCHGSLEPYALRHAEIPRALPRCHRCALR